MSDRFFIEHGTIHDRATGRHLTAENESDYPDRLLAILNGQQDAVSAQAELVRRSDAENATLRAALSEAIAAMERANDAVKYPRSEIRLAAIRALDLAVTAAKKTIGET